VQVAGLQQLAAQGDAGLIGIAQKRVLDDDGPAPARAQLAHEVLQEQIGGFTWLKSQWKLFFYPAHFWVEIYISKKIWVLHLKLEPK